VKLKAPKGAFLLSGIFMGIWLFCERFYGRKPVEVMCLRLQQEHDAVVGLVIWFCWHYAHSQFIPLAVFERAQQLIHDSQQQLILPLRQLRKNKLLKGQPQAESIAQAILHAEILLEKNQLELINEQTADAIVTQASCDTVGLLDYLLNCGVGDAEPVVCLLYAHAAASLD
jgi:uncharacterized protein (TIGR02444 family)